MIPERGVPRGFGAILGIFFGAKIDSGPPLQNCCSELLTGSRGSILDAMEPAV